MSGAGFSCFTMPPAKMRTSLARSPNTTFSTPRTAGSALVLQTPTCDRVARARVRPPPRAPARRRRARLDPGVERVVHQLGHAEAARHLARLD